ncbi:HutD family protein, partial [Escherichia coli]
MEPMLISAMDKPLQPWRNGGGVTRQLLAWPDDENWLLRISMANVSQDGP